MCRFKSNTAVREAPAPHHLTARIRCQGHRMWISLHEIFISQGKKKNSINQKIRRRIPGFSSAVSAWWYERLPSGVGQHHVDGAAG